jgi:diaminopimelate dehydrogenase
MRRGRIAVVGLGKLGIRCAEAVAASDALFLAAVVRRPETVREPLPPSVGKSTVARVAGELEQVDAALLCVPLTRILDAASILLRKRIPIVECARLHGEDFIRHKEQIHRLALHSGVPAIVGAGWDPGALSLVRGLFALLAPHGSTMVSPQSGSSLHHLTLAASVKGVKDALATERPSGSGKLQRYVYVELEKGADPSSVTRAVESDPLFLGEETFVFPVESLLELESQNRGVTVERRTSSRDRAHPHLLFEARFDEHRMAAEVMVAAVRALPSLRPGGTSLFDVPPRALFPSASFERDWI